MRRYDADHANKNRRRSRLRAPPSTIDGGATRRSWGKLIRILALGTELRQCLARFRIDRHSLPASALRQWDREKVPLEVDVRPPQIVLFTEAREWWKKINDGWQLDDSALLLLESALESFDRMREAQRILRREGIVIRDRFGQKKQHPATLTERDAKMSMIRSLKALEPRHRTFELAGPPARRKVGRSCRRTDNGSI